MTNKQIKTHKAFSTKIHKQTPKAFLTDHGWFPKSQCKVFETSTGLPVVIAPVWLIAKKDIPYNNQGRIESKNIYFTFGQVTIIKGYNF